jgi:hypothetical protein
MCKRSLAAIPIARLAGTAILLCHSLAAISQAQPGFDIGICMHLANNPAMLPRELNLIAQTGADSVRTDVFWSHAEIERGQLTAPSGVDDLVNQALKVNVQPLLILDYGNPFYDSGDKPVSPQALAAFARYAAFVVRHFKGRVHMYEMWNEWNGMVGYTHRGSPEDYVRFVRVVYPAVKAVDPSAVFLAGAIGGLKLDWLSAMLSAGALGSFDALSIHPYNFNESARTGDAWAHDMLATEGVIHRYTGGRDIPLYITEMGWPTYSGHGGSSLKEAATYLAQMFLLARTLPFIKGIWWYDFRDDGEDGNNMEDTFGLVDSDLEPKPAFAALKAVAHTVGEARGVEDLPTGSPSLRALRFRLRGTNQVLAMWNANQGSPIRVHVIGTSSLQIRSIEPQGYNADASGPDAVERTIEISNIPVLVTGANLTLRSFK